MKYINNILKEYYNLGIGEQIDYAKFYMYSIITHSTAIEGSTVTEIENRLLFDEGIGTQKPLIEQMMNLDLKEAYEQSLIYARKHTNYSVELLCNLSALVMKHTGTEYNTMLGNFSSAKGELRLLNVSAGIGGKSYISYQKVPAQLEEFCKWLNSQRKSLNHDYESIYNLSFEAHYRLVCIHPWADGNGRMSRLVMNMIQYEFGVVPSIVKKENRKQYIESLERSQNKATSTPFLSFMLEHHCDNILKQIAEFKKSVNETVADIKNVADKLTDRQQNIIDIIQNVATNVAVNTKYLSEQLCVNRKTIQRDLVGLQQRKLIQWVGSNKTGHWEIIELK